jgi:hypothetical protein
MGGVRLRGDILPYAEGQMYPIVLTPSNGHIACPLVYPCLNYLRLSLSVYVLTVTHTYLLGMFVVENLLDCVFLVFS